MITVDAKGAIGDLQRIILGLDDAVAEGLVELAKVGQEEAKNRAPKKTGALAKAINVDRIGAKVQLVADTDYAHYVEYGRGAVRAKGKALRFVINGQVVFRKSVGPAEARPFMRYAGEAMSKSRIVERSVEKLIR